MDDVFILNEDGTDAARAGLLRLHEAVGRREPGRPEAALSPEELLAQFRTADPTRNAACLPWLLKTYAAGGYRLEDLSKAHDTLVTFARLRGLLPNTATIDGEVRNPRKLGSHVTLASLWTVIAPLVETERLAQEEEVGDKVDSGKERALSQSRVLHRSNRMVVAVPMTEEASCWWGQGTQWCTAARKNNAFENYHKKAPLIVVCLRKSGDLPARKLQLYVYAYDMQFMDENDAKVSKKIILERWQDLKALLHWAVGRNGMALKFIPRPLRTKATCTAAVGRNGLALRFIPRPLRTKAICTAAVGSNGLALQFIPKYLHTEAICLAAVGKNGWALEYVPEQLCTEAICLTAVDSDGEALTYIPQSLRTEAICLAAATECVRALEYVPAALRTEAMYLTAVGRNAQALYYVPEHIRTKAICLDAVSRDGQLLRYVPEHLRTEAMYSAAVGSSGQALDYVPEPLRTKAICLTAVTQSGYALDYVPEPIRTEEICLAAVGNNGWALQYVPEPIRTEEICLTAVGGAGGALQYVPEPIRTEAICTVAVGSNGMALQFIPEHLCTELVCLAAASRNEQEFVPKNGKTNTHESYDLILEDLENYLKNL